MLTLLVGVAVLGARPTAARAEDRTWAELEPAVERLYAEERLTELVAVADEAMRAAENALGPDDPKIAHLITTIGLAYRALAAQAMGAYGRTEPFLRQAIRLFEQAGGPEHPQVAMAVNNLGELYSTQARYQEALPLFERALAIWEKTHGPEDFSVAIALKNLAWIDKLQGRYVESQARYQRARGIMEEHFRIDDPLYQLILNNLASLQALAAAQPDEAERRRVESREIDQEAASRLKLSVLEEIVGPDHPNVADVVTDLAGLVAAQGQLEEADALYRRALAIEERGTDDDAQKQTITLLNHLIELSTAQHRQQDAKPLYTQLLTLLERRFGAKHEELIPVLERYAQCLETLDDSAGAQAARARADRIREKPER